LKKYWTPSWIATGWNTPGGLSMQANAPIITHWGWPTYSVSWKMSLTSIGFVVAPQVTRSFWPRITPGVPGKDTPLTFMGPSSGSSSTTRWYSQKVEGTLSERCGSLAMIGLPLGVAPPVTPHSLLPTKLWRRSSASSKSGCTASLSAARRAAFAASARWVACSASHSTA
jgi:hypothetical protein